MKDLIELNNNAINLREKFGFDPLTPIDLFNVVLNQLPLTLLFYPISQQTKGICIKDDEIPIICINSDMNRANQRFTLAHEIYHLLVEENSFNFFFCNNSNDDSSEKEANMFASFLLMPKEALNYYIKKNNINEWDIDTIIKIEQYFKIGHFSMLMRLKQEKYITEKQFQKLNSIEIIKEFSSRGFSTELYEEVDEKYRFKVFGKQINLIKDLYENNGITSGKRDELLFSAFRDDLVYNLEEDDIFE